MNHNFKIFRVTYLSKYHIYNLLKEILIIFYNIFIMSDMVENKDTNDNNSKKKNKKMTPDNVEKKPRPKKSKEIVDIYFSIKLTKVKNNCTIAQIYESLNILQFGEIMKIIICSKFSDPINNEDPLSEVYIYFKGSNIVFKKHTLLNKVLNSPPDKKAKLVHFMNGDIWESEQNTLLNHFRIDNYNPKQKSLIIQSICTTKNSNDINWLFREHGIVEQVDIVWIKTSESPTPTPKRCQSYVYFKEWGDESFTYKLLDELNRVGVFTIKYNFNGYTDLLWIYQLLPKEQNMHTYDFEFGQYQKWIPNDDSIYGNREDKQNKLNWIFSYEGRFAYSKIIEEEILTYGGLFVGPDKIFYKIEVEIQSAPIKPIEISWKITDNNYNENSDDEENDELEIAKAKQFILEALQKCLNKNDISIK